MSKDYAHRRPKKGGGKAKPRQPKARQRQSNGLPGWLWGLMGLTVGLAVAAIAFITLRPVEPEFAEAEPAAPAPQVQQQSSPKIPPKQPPRFKFYDGLKEAEVRPSEEAYKVETPPPASQDSNRYLVQAGSFKSRDDAEKRKANLALIGIESKIAQVDLQGKGIRYRVQIGPALTRVQTEKTMQQLRENRIDSFATRVDG